MADPEGGSREISPYKIGKYSIFRDIFERMSGGKKEEGPQLNFWISPSKIMLCIRSWVLCSFKQKPDLFKFIVSIILFFFGLVG